MTGSPLSDFFLLVLAHLAVKGLVLLVLAFGTTAVLRRQAADQRHVVWVALLVALLALPALVILGPGIGLSLGSEVAARAEAHLTELGLPGAPASTVAEINAAPVVGSVGSQPGAAPWGPILGGLLLACWLLGGSALAVRVLWQYRRIHGQARTAAVLATADWLADLAEAAARMGLRRSARLVTDARFAAPTVLGWRSPILLLPADAPAWSSGRRQAVLRHELLHVRRGDPVVHLLFQLVCSFYWYNPLVWRAARAARIERECACDDRVVASGVGVTAYARELLASAQGIICGPRVLGATTEFAGPSELRVRICALLDPRGVARRVTRGWLAAVGLFAAVLVTAVASVLPMPAHAFSTTDRPHLLRLFYATDANGPAVDLLVDGRPVLLGIRGSMGASWTISPTPIEPGEHQLAVRLTADTSQVLARDRLVAAPGRDYLTLVLGRPGQMVLRSVEDDLILPAAGHQKVRVVHGAPGTGSFSVTIRELGDGPVTSGRPLFRTPELRFGELTGYAEFASGPRFAVEQTIQGKRSPLMPHMITQDGAVTFIVLTNPRGG